MRKVRKLARLVRHPLYRRGLMRGVAAAVEHEIVLESQDWRTIVDVGANRGQFALVARRRHPAARILSFEPIAAAASRFRALFSDDPLISVEQIALASEATTASMHVSRRDDSSSLLPITVLQQRVFPGTEESRRESVLVQRLDAILTRDQISPPALLKIDVQGGELGVLEGAGGDLGKFDHIYVECSFVELYAGQALAHEVIAFLRARGFVLRGIHNPAYDGAGRCVQADFLFHRSSDLAAALDESRVDF